MTTVQVPAFFHELFGKKTTTVELACIVSFALGSTAFISYVSSEYLSELGVFQIGILIVLLLDVSGGVVANFSYWTNNQYRESSKNRLVFIGVHIQPVLLALVLGDFWIPAIATWIFTIASALLSNSLIQHPAQRVIAATAMATGLAGLIILAPDLPASILLLLVFYLIKVIFSFSVDHYAPRNTPE